MVFSIKNWTYKQIRFKNRIEHIIIFPFVLLGKLIFYIFGKKESFHIYYFFPFYHTGGAERVHSAIVNANAHVPSIIYFTKKSENTTMLDAYKKAGHQTKDISQYTDNKWIYFVNLMVRGYFAAKINSQKSKPLVFNGQCNFAYKLSPWINSNIRQIELIHSFNSFSYIRIPYIKFYEKTIMISKKKIEEHKLFYDKTKTPKEFKQHISYIGNATFVSNTMPEKPVDKLRILYVGRNSPEKRLGIILDIAKRFENQPKVEFLFMGVNEDELNATSNCKFLGCISNVAEINNIYKSCNLVIVTSNTEGMPLCIIEGMAMGCAVIATAVGDIGFHINDSVGLLIKEVFDEQKIIETTCNYINLIIDDNSKLSLLQNNSFEYAKKVFNIHDFDGSYQKLMEVPSA